MLSLSKKDLTYVGKYGHLFRFIDVSAMNDIDELLKHNISENHFRN